MYGLRHINNNYKEHACSRSDFIITGHPEYKNGRVKEVSDTNTKPHFQERSRLRKDRGVVTIQKPPGHSFEQFWRELTSNEPALPEDRRSIKAACFSGSQTCGGSVNVSHRGSARTVLKLTDKGSAPSDVRDNHFRTTASFASSLTWANVCRHFSGLHDELLDLRRRAQRDPEGVKKELLQQNRWKFYAEHLEQAQRLEAKFDRSRQTRAAVILAAHSTLPGVRPRSPPS
eukprot:TRINITY_DN20777_c0_g1_i12.p1 TRINITY_DN20777_c0_g1~~TRINITY_DN20777_c0_g1_i12.p1  ORF type:complete len:230 (-),score=26.83 TRINITY_DN20777_c0_g1_i12:71-760(-)